MGKKYGEWEFDPFEATGIVVPRKNRADALADCADYIKEQMLDRTGAGRTSVKGGKWVRGLTPEYAKKKAEESSAKFANLELTGEFLDSFDVSAKGTKKILVEVGDDQRGKAEGHLTGLYGAHGDKPRPRQFMPVGDEELAPDIMKGVKKILNQYAEEEDDGE